VDRAEHLLLEAADRQDAARSVISPVIATSWRTGRPTARGERRRHRDARRRPVLRDGAGRDVDVDVSAVPTRCFGGIPSFGGVRGHVGEAARADSFITSPS
jgi:hypothetical protein